MRIARFLLIAIFAVVAISPVFAQDAAAQTPAELCAAAEPVEPETREFTQAEQVLEDGVDYRAIFCTDAGAIYIDLLEDYSPVTVNNFVFLAQNNYYNGTIFHRVIEGFMAQGGDPLGTGTGGPGYQFNDEISAFLTFDRPGWLAMANAGSAGGVGTNGSQFFITTVPTTHLDYRHTIFGEVLEGQENVLAIKIRDPEAGGDATALNTVLVVTDPATVTTVYEAPASLTQEDVAVELAEENVRENLGELMGETVGAEIIGIASRVLTAEEIADESGVSAAVLPLLEAHNVEYVIESTLSNATCDAALLPFYSASYTVYKTPSVAEAKAALADAALASYGVAGGLSDVTELAFGNPVYSTTTTSCNEQAGTRARVFTQRGSYLVKLEIVIPEGVQYTPGVIMEQFTGFIFDRAFGDVLINELR